MAGKRIYQLTEASTLNGTDNLPLSQGTATTDTKRATISSLATKFLSLFGITISGSTVTQSNATVISGALKYTGSAITDGYFLKTDELGNLTYAQAGVIGGTANYIPKWLSATTLGSSVIYQDGSNIGIGTITPQSKLELSTGTFYLSDTSIAHGMTDAVPTNVVGKYLINNTSGGLAIGGYSKDGLGSGLGLSGNIGGSSSTIPAVAIVGAVKSGTTVGQVASGDMLFSLSNGDSSTKRLIVLGNGDLGIGILTAAGITARNHIKGSTADSTAYGLKVSDVADSSLFSVRNDAYIEIGKLAITPSTELILTHKTAAVTVLQGSADGAQTVINGGSRVFVSVGGANRVVTFATYSSILGGLSVNDSGNAPVTCAKFEVESTTQGILFPRMTTTQRDAISTPLAGLVIYNTTTNKQNFYNGTIWEVVTSA